MTDTITNAERREAAAVLGEMAADRLFTAINERFQELEDRDGLTKADVARRLGAAPQAVSRWMNEPRNLTVKTAGRLLAAMEAHLLFDLDRFEDIGGNSCNMATGPAPVVFHTLVYSNSSDPASSPTTTIDNSVRIISNTVPVTAVRSLLTEDA